MKFLFLLSSIWCCTVFAAINPREVTDENGWGVISSPSAIAYNTKGKEAETLTGGDFFYIIKSDNVKVNGEKALFVSFRKLKDQPSYVVYEKDCFIASSRLPDKNEEESYKAELKLRSNVAVYFKAVATRQAFYNAAYKKHIKGSPMEEMVDIKEALAEKRKALSTLAKDLEEFKVQIKKQNSSEKQIRLVEKGRELRADATRLPAEIKSLEEKLEACEVKAKAWAEAHPMNTKALYASSRWKRMTAKLESMEATLFEEGLIIPSLSSEATPSDDAR